MGTTPPFHRTCSLSAKARSEYESIYNDPGKQGSIEWHIAGRALFAAGLIDALPVRARATAAPQAKPAANSRRRKLPEPDPDDRGSLYR